MSNDVDIRIREDGSVVVIRNFDALITASDKAGTAITGLKTTLETLKGISLKVLIDQVKLLATELKTLNSGSTELTALKNALTALGGSGAGLTRLHTILTGFSNSVTGLGQLHNALQQLSTSGNSFDRLNTHLAALPPLIAHVTALHTALSALVALNPQISILAAEVRNLAGSTTAIRQFQQSIVALNASMANLVRQSQQIANALQNLNSGARSAASGFGELSSILGGLSAYMLVSKINDWVDAWMQAAGLIHIATESVSEFNAVQEKLFNIAQETRTPLEATVQLYSRIQRAAISLGSSQNEVIKFTENVGQALAIQHSKQGETVGSLIQLSQALGGGTVRGQEFKSMMDALPVVMRTVAKNIDGGAVSVSQLRKRMLEGKFTSDELFRALIKGSPELQKAFEDSAHTIAQSFTVLDNSMIKYSGHLNEVTGYSNALGAATKLLGDNIKVLGSVGTGALLSISIAAAIALNSFINITGKLKLVGEILLTTPWIRWIGLVVAATLTLLSFSDSIVGSGEKATTLGTIFKGLFNLFKSSFSQMGAWITDTYDSWDSRNNTMIAQGNTLKDVYSDIKIGIKGEPLEGILTILRVFELALLSIDALVRKIGDSFLEIPDIFDNAINGIIDTITQNVYPMINKLIGYINKAKAIFGVAPLPMLSIPKDSPKVDNHKTNDDAILQKAAEDTIGLLTTPFKELIASAIATVPKTVSPPANLNNKGKGDPIVTKTDEKKTLQSAYEALLGSINKVEAAYYEEAKAQKTLNDAAAAGLLNERAKELGIDVLTYKKQLLADITAKYKDQKDPLAAINRELAEELKVLKMLPEQRAIYVEYEKQVKALKDAGGLQDRDAIENAKKLLELKKTIVEKQQESKVGAIRDQVMGDYRSKQTDPLNTEQAYTDLLKDPNAKDPKKAILDNEMTKNPDLFAGTQEAIDAQITAIEMMYSRIDFLRKNDIISEETAKFQRTKIKQQEQQILNKTTEDTFNNLAVLSKSGNRKLAIIGKAAAITMATIKGFEAIQLAIASPPGWPYNAPNVASVTIAQAANLASIAGVGFMTGGSFDVSGSGGHDSQTVAFRASPGERVSIQTPQQYRKGDPNGNSSQGQQKPADNNIRIVNVLDPALVGNYLSTREGERLVLNVIEKNSSSVRNFVRES